MTEKAKDEGGYKFRRRIEDRLREVLDPTDDPKLWSFHEGFTDSRIAKEFETSKWIVKSVRRQMFGNVRVWIPQQADLLAPVEGFEARLAAVEATLLDIRTKLASLLE